MRVSRKGQVVSSLEADWLELTAAYYRKGWSLVDSFVYWDTPKGRFDVGLSVTNLSSYRTASSVASHQISYYLWSTDTGFSMADADT